MNKKMTIKQQYEKIEKSLIRRGVELPYRPKQIRSSSLERIKKYSAEITRQRKSEASKKYWQELKENKPEVYRERVTKLQEARKRASVHNPPDSYNVGDYSTPDYEVSEPEIETPEVGETEIDLDYEVDEETGETFDSYRDWEKSFERELFNIEHADDKIIYEDVVINSFLEDVYERPSLNGSRFVLNWIQTLIDEYKKPFVADLITVAKREGYQIDVKMLYEEDKASAMVTGFMRMWYDKGQFDTVKSEGDTFSSFNLQFRKKMGKEFQGSKYSFGTSLMKAIEGDINADESMQNYG